jgi:hypothetical protein
MLRIKSDTESEKYRNLGNAAYNEFKNFVALTHYNAVILKYIKHFLYLKK